LNGQSWGYTRRNYMSQERIELHIYIADKHKNFIGFLQQCANIGFESFPPDDFSVWLVIASYYRAIHLLEALFAKNNKTVLSSFDYYSADSRRCGFLMPFPALRKEFKSLQRLAFHAENFPERQIADYDTVTNFQEVLKTVVNGHLLRIEKVVQQELGKG